MENKFRNQELHEQHMKASNRFYISVIIYFFAFFLLLKFYKPINLYIIIGVGAIGALISLYFAFKAIYYSLKAYREKIYKK